LLIILDTVRGFNLSAYGYERETTPNIARLAKRGVRFEHAYSTAPWTLPSHASLFTGRPPNELSADMLSPLDDTWPTLAEAMSARGYATAGFVANLGYCTAESGLARGFSHYEDVTTSWLLVLHRSSVMRVVAVNTLVKLLGGAEGVRIAKTSTPIARLYRKDADQVNEDFLRWIPSSKGRPFFAFLNYFDAHRPYLPPSPYDTKYSPNIRDRYRVVKNGSKSKLPPEAAEVLTDAYDGTLVYLDDRIGKLTAELDRRGILQNTLVIITADHGEQFGEHGLFFHANSLYTQLLRVPLIILGTNRVPAGVTVQTPVSLLDVAATVLAATDSAGSESFPGQTLARYYAGDSTKQATALPLFASLGAKAQLIEAFAPKTGFRSVMMDGMHYIRSGKNQKGEVREELFDLARDPRELNDLMTSDTGRAVLPRLRAALAAGVPTEAPKVRTASR
ncbi:MAG: sulfatase, partial [Gemmatimonadaceae bacterium]